MKRYKQTTYESCLACCLLEAVKEIKPIKINQDLELDCIVHSMKLSKHDFVIGHLDFISKKFNLPFRRIINSVEVYNYIKSLKFSPKIKTEIKKVNLALIDKYADKRPIIAIDFYHFYKVFPFHYPHFIMILGKKGNKYLIYDPWFGIERNIDRDSLAEALYSLKDYLMLSPELIIPGIPEKKLKSHPNLSLIDKFKNTINHHKSLA